MGPTWDLRRKCEPPARYQPDRGGTGYIGVQGGDSIAKVGTSSMKCATNKHDTMQKKTEWVMERCNVNTKQKRTKKNRAKQNKTKQNKREQMPKDNLLIDAKAVVYARGQHKQVARLNSNARLQERT